MTGLELRSSRITTYEDGCFDAINDNLERIHLGSVVLEEESDLLIYTSDVYEFLGKRRAIYVDG